jgi:four helix bundle protein
MKYDDFTQMSVYQKALNLLVYIYKLLKDYPKEETYILVSDMKRAVNSICHNIAEGFGRFEPKDKTRFYKIARGSSYELTSQVMASLKLDYIDTVTESEVKSTIFDIINELNSLIKTLENN